MEAVDAQPIDRGTLLGRVLLESVIGHGATATVYRGRHVHLGTDVAVKVVSPRPGHGDEDRKRFLREARVAARLNDPSIVHVYDFGEVGETCYLVMEYVAGTTLEHYIGTQAAPLCEEIVIKLMRRIACALRVAHTAGLVHRDLKPANVLVDRRGLLKVADFGLTRGSGAPSTGRDGLCKGTPAYMAPECATVGMRVDQRADLYALGVIGYELAFGRVPYEGDLEEVLQAHRRGDACFELPTRCSPATIAILRRLLAPEPANRLQSAEELLERLPPPAEQPAPTTSPPNTPLPTTGRAEHPERASASEEFGFLVRFLEERLGSRVSDVPEGRVVHSTLRERALVWGLLAMTVVFALTSYLAYPG